MNASAEFSFYPEGIPACSPGLGRRNRFDAADLPWVQSIPHINQPQRGCGNIVIAKP